MRLRVLGCAGGSAPGHLLSSYLVDEVLAIDAGALTTALSVSGQRQVEAVAFTHGHLDHVWSFPLFLANRFDDGSETCHVYASAYTMDTIREHLFNDRIWPDFTAAKIEDRPIVDFHDVEPGDVSTALDRYEIRAIALEHTVPCQAYLIREKGVAASWLVCGDTTTTDEVWRIANETDDLRGIFIECSFTNDLHDLARASKHMTPSLLAADLAKFNVDAPIHVIHLKPGYGPGITKALKALGDDRIRIVERGEIFRMH